LREIANASPDRLDVSILSVLPMFSRVADVLPDVLHDLLAGE
jgi:hypothetical protein